MSTTNQVCQTDSILFDFERAQCFRSKGRFCDLTIQSTASDNKKLIRCHKVIVASVSPFFENKLRKGTISSLSIPQVDHETLELLINYMYGSGGLITLNSENVLKICSGAMYLKLNQLVTTCLKFIRRLVTLKDVIQVFKFSLTDNLPALRKTCINFIIENLEKLKAFGFLDLDCQQVNILVEHGIKNQTVAMADILKSVSEWLHSNKEERQHYAVDLISKIPLAKMRLQNLKKLIRQDDFLNNIPEIHSMYVDAVEEIGLKLERAQTEKRKATELGNVMKEERATTNCEHISEPGSSKRGRFSNEDDCASNETSVISEQSNTKSFLSQQPNSASVPPQQSKEMSLPCQQSKETNLPSQQSKGTNLPSQQSKETNLPSQQPNDDIPNNISGVKIEAEVEVALTSTGRKKKAFVYFVSKEVVRSRSQNSIVSYDLETKNLEILGPNLEFQINTSLVYHNHKLYSLGDMKTRKGGGEYNPVAVFSVTTKHWEENAPDHVGVRAGFKTVVLHDYLYAVGGSPHAGGEYCDVKRLKIQKPYEKWEDVAKVPVGSCGFGICVANGCIYVLGGNTYVHSRLPSIHNSVICYTPECNKWSSKQDMPVPRRGFAVAVVCRNIYVLGGSKSATGTDDHVSSVDIYDTEEDTWTQGISMNKSRQFFSAIVFNDCIYALGGDSEDLPTMERFSIERQVWEVMGSLPKCGMYHSVDFQVDDDEL